MLTLKGFSELSAQLERISKAYDQLPTEIGTIVVRFSKERFRSQDWYDKTREPWPKRKLSRTGKRRSQTLLVDTGRLKRSIRKIQANQNCVIVGTDVEYAEIHNNGGVIKGTFTVKKHKRKEHSRMRKKRKETVQEHTVQSHKRTMNTTIPKRRFIGKSEKLEQKLLLHVEEKFEIAIKNNYHA